MGSIGLSVLALGCFLVSAVCGALSVAILARSGVSRATSFGWGAVLGPIGLATAVAIAVQRSRSAPETEDLPW